MSIDSERNPHRKGPGRRLRPAVPRPSPSAPPRLSPGACRRGSRASQRRASWERGSSSSRTPLRSSPARRPPPPRTNRTRRVPHPVLIGHAASLSQEEALAAARLARPAAPAPGLVLLADALLATAKTLKAAAMLDLAVEAPPRNRTCAPRPEIEHARRAPCVWPVRCGGSAARRPLLPRALTPSQSAAPPRAPRGRPAHAHRGAAGAACAVRARAAPGDPRLSRGRT